MTNHEVWDVDRVAAAELLACLRDAAMEDLPQIAAAAFSKHRRLSHEWAARRVHQELTQTLEKTASQEFGHRDAIWADGYNYAEQRLLTCNPLTLLGTFVPSNVTKGQALRSMIRSAKKRQAA